MMSALCKTRSVFVATGSRLCMAPMTGNAISRLQLTRQHLLGSVKHGSEFSTRLISTTTVGSKYTSDFKAYAVQDGKVVSFFHDIALDLDLERKTANMVVEIPRWTNGKFEISTKLAGNPIVQDEKKGKVRFVKNLFPYKGYIHNYGAFPQTWEDPSVQNKDIEGVFGDGDPLDVCEIGERVGSLGGIKRVKILGSLALIDDGELDWKIIAVDVEDPLADQLNDIGDVETKCPGYLDATVFWFRNYKRPDGKPENEFAFNAKYRSLDETMEVIHECRAAWSKLISGGSKVEKAPTIVNATLQGTPGFSDKVADVDVRAQPKPEASVPVDLDRSYFL